MQQQRTTDKVLDFLQQMRGEHHGFTLSQKSQQNLIEILAVENIVSRKGFIHENVVRALRKGKHDLKLVFLARGAASDGTILRQSKKVHKRVKTLFVEARKVLGIEAKMLLCVQRREKTVLARGKGEASDVFVRDRLVIECYRTLKARKAENALHQRGLTRAVFAEEPHDLPPRQRKGNVVERFFCAIAFRKMFDFEHGVLLKRHTVTPKTSAAPSTPA